jgi:hypothetical protein
MGFRNGIYVLMYPIPLYHIHSLHLDRNLMPLAFLKYTQMAILQTDAPLSFDLAAGGFLLLLVVSIDGSDCVNRYNEADEFVQPLGTSRVAQRPHAHEINVGECSG